MSLRRLLPVLMLALLLAPLGRMAAAEAKLGTQVSHCGGPQQPANDPGHGKAATIDCTIACAAMAPAAESLMAPVEAVPVTPESPPVALPSGVRPEASPPPPRFA